VLSLNTQGRGSEDILLVTSNQFFFFNLSMSGAGANPSSSKTTLSAP